MNKIATAIAAISCIVLFNALAPERAMAAERCSYHTNPSDDDQTLPRRTIGYFPTGDVFRAPQPSSYAMLDWGMVESGLTKLHEPCLRLRTRRVSVRLALFGTGSTEVIRLEQIDRLHARVTHLFALDRRTWRTSRLKIHASRIVRMKLLRDVLRRAREVGISQCPPLPDHPGIVSTGGVGWLFELNDGDKYYAGFRTNLDGENAVRNLSRYLENAVSIHAVLDDPNR